MSETPADIRATANRLVHEFNADWYQDGLLDQEQGDAEKASAEQAIAEALMAERERCAKIAGDYDSLAAEAILYEREAAMSTCETCKHFEPFPEGVWDSGSTMFKQPFGGCGRWVLSYGWDGGLQDNECHVESADGWGMFVGPKFGCILHEQHS